ncbi:MAG: hypothetical protein AAF587_45145, partial [Bacteroidota bacterium]
NKKRVEKQWDGEVNEASYETADDTSIYECNISMQEQMEWQIHLSQQMLKSMQDLRGEANSQKTSSSKGRNSTNSQPVQRQRDPSMYGNDGGGDGDSSQASDDSGDEESTITNSTYPTVQSSTEDKKGATRNLADDPRENPRTPMRIYWDQLKAIERSCYLSPIQVEAVADLNKKKVYTLQAKRDYQKLRIPFTIEWKYTTLERFPQIRSSIESYFFQTPLGYLFDTTFLDAYRKYGPKMSHRDSTFRGDR